MNLQIRNINYTESVLCSILLLVLSYELTNKEYQPTRDIIQTTSRAVLSYELTNKEYQQNRGEYDRL